MISTLGSILISHCYLQQEFLGERLCFCFVRLCVCVCVSGHERDNSKSNAQIFTNLFTEVETLKSQDEFDNEQNPSSSSKVIEGYLLILVRFSIEIYIKVSMI